MPEFDLNSAGGNSETRDSEGGNSEDRDAEGRDSEGREKPRTGTLPERRAETGIPKPGIPKSGIPKTGIPKVPRGPKDQKNSRFRLGLKISSENEIFERATHRGPIFCGEIETSRLKFSSEIKNFDRDQKFRSGSNIFDRWAA